MNHVRADRWYKLGRTILYGRLEDEAPFQTVRRLVQYEDYALRVMRDAGIPTAAPLGIVELTPEREYMLVTEFFDGAVEIGEAEVDDQIIDEGLALVRRLWDAGLAHRDIKPANLMVKDGHLVVIDVAFAQVRPSPWREAVDLANMMLVLAVRTDAERVYQRALAYFTPDEIAEAFAAARGIASPTQLRIGDEARRSRPLAQFRALAPRAAADLAAAVGAASGARWPLGIAGARRARPRATSTAMFTPAELPIGDEPACGTGRRHDPDGPGRADGDAPCRASRPSRPGWSVGGVRGQPGRRRGSGWTPTRPADTPSRSRLRPPGACAVDDATEVPSDEVGWRRFEQPEQLPPALRVRAHVRLRRRLRDLPLRVRRRANASADRSPSTPRSPSNRGTSSSRRSTTAPA